MFLCILTRATYGEHEEQFECGTRDTFRIVLHFSNPEICGEKATARPKVEHIKPMRALSRVPRVTGSLPTNSGSEHGNLTEIQKMKNKKVLQSVVQIELAIGLIDHCALYPSITYCYNVSSGILSLFRILEKIL